MPEPAANLRRRNLILAGVLVAIAVGFYVAFFVAMSN